MGGDYKKYQTATQFNMRISSKHLAFCTEVKIGAILREQCKNGLSTHKGPIFSANKITLSLFNSHFDHLFSSLPSIRFVHDTDK